MMQAQVINHFGDISVFKTINLPKPKAKPGYVLIHVHATSVNPVDTKIRSGSFAAISPEFPAILHGDVAGVVVEVGEGIRHFKIGDEVFGCAGGVKGEGGALAEYMLADETLLAKKPARLSMAEAAALPLVGITAWEALFEYAMLAPTPSQAEQKVLIHGGAGGVGHIAIQLAKYSGAKVYTTVSNKAKAAQVNSLLKNDVEIIFYKEEGVQQYVDRLTDGQGFDIVIDTIGGDNIENSIAAIRLYGTVVTILSRANCDLSMLQAKAGRLSAVFMLIPLLHGVKREQHRTIMQQLAKLAEQERLQPLLDPHQFTFQEVSKAHALLESGQAIGKIVLVRE